MWNDSDDDAYEEAGDGEDDNDPISTHEDPLPTEVHNNKRSMCKPTQEETLVPPEGVGVDTPIMPSESVFAPSPGMA